MTQSVVAIDRVAASRGNRAKRSDDVPVFVEPVNFGLGPGPSELLLMSGIPGNRIVMIGYWVQHSSSFGNGTWTFKSGTGPGTPLWPTDIVSAPRQVFDPGDSGNVHWERFLVGADVFIELVTNATSILRGTVLLASIPDST